MPTMEQLNDLMDEPSTADKDAQDKLPKLMSWWDNITVHSYGSRPPMSKDDYDQLLAR
jgi:hypothetical protein